MVPMTRSMNVLWMNKNSSRFIVASPQLRCHIDFQAHLDTRPIRTKRVACPFQRPVSSNFNNIKFNRRSSNTSMKILCCICTRSTARIARGTLLLLNWTHSENMRFLLQKPEKNNLTSEMTGAKGTRIIIWQCAIYMAQKHRTPETDACSVRNMRSKNKYY